MGGHRVSRGSRLSVYTTPAFGHKGSVLYWLWLSIAATLAYYSAWHSFRRGIGRREEDCRPKTMARKRHVRALDHVESDRSRGPRRSGSGPLQLFLLELFGKAHFCVNERWQ